MALVIHQLAKELEVMQSKPIEAKGFTGSFGRMVTQLKHGVDKLENLVKNLFEGKGVKWESKQERDLNKIVKQLQIIETDLNETVEAYGKAYSLGHKEKDQSLIVNTEKNFKTFTEDLTKHLNNMEKALRLLNDKKDMLGIPKVQATKVDEARVDLAHLKQYVKDVKNNLQPSNKKVDDKAKDKKEDFSFYETEDVEGLEEPLKSEKLMGDQTLAELEKTLADVEFKVETAKEEKNPELDALENFFKSPKVPSKPAKPAGLKEQLAKQPGEVQAKKPPPKPVKPPRQKGEPIQSQTKKEKPQVPPKPQSQIAEKIVQAPKWQLGKVTKPLAPAPSDPLDSKSIAGSKQNLKTAVREILNSDISKLPKDEVVENAIMAFNVFLEVSWKDNDLEEIKTQAKAKIKTIYGLVKQDVPEQVIQKIDNIQ